MKVKLLRDSRVTVKAGETIEVSSAVAAFLVSIGSAVEAAEEAPRPKTTTKKTTKK